MRFFSAQFEAYVTDDRWLTWAGHANAMATRLSEGLAAVNSIELLHPVEANEIFLRMPEDVFAKLQTTGFGVYPLAPSDDGTGTIRLVTSFDTDPADVDRLIAAAQAG